MKVCVEPLADTATTLAEWRTLFSQARNDSIFLSPEWVEAWLAGAPTRIALWSIRGVADETVQLLGIVGVRMSRRPAIVGPTTAHLHEFGVAASDSIYVECNDFIVSHDAPPEARELALGALLDAIGPIDEFVIRNARADLIAAAERLAAAHSLSIRRLQSQPCFMIDLDRIRTGGDGYLSACSSSLRTQVRRSQKLYEGRGAVTLHVAQSKEEREAAWSDLVRLHEDGWRRRGETGVFANAAFTAFHQRLANLAPQCVDLVTIRAGDEVIGALYNLVHGDRAFNYQSGFKFEDDNQLKPGMLAHSLAAQHYLENGFTTYELLAGDAQYKRRLGEETEILTTIVLENRRGLRAGLRRMLRSMRRNRSNAAKTHQT